MRKNNKMNIVFILILLMSLTTKSKLNIKISYNEIDDKVKEIEQNVNKDKYKRVRVFENSKRGPSEHMLYYDKYYNLKKIELGAGDRSSTMYFYAYYFKNGLIHINETKIKHNLKDYENSSKTKTLIDKFYYRDNKLLRWIKPNGELNNGTKDIFTKEKKQLEIIDSYLFFKKNQSKIVKSYKGKGNFSKLLILDGRKLKIRLKYNNSDPDSKIVIYTSNDQDDLKEIIFKQNQPLKNKESIFEIESIYAFKVRIKSKNPEARWSLKLQFKGEDVELG